MTTDVTDYTTYEQDPDETLDYAANFTPHCTRYREPDTDYAVGTRVRPFRPNGFQYSASVAGRTAGREPVWPTTVGGTVVDGSVTWTCEAVSAASLKRTVSAVTWTVDTGLTKSAEALSGTLAVANLGAGTLGEKYFVRAKATCSDSTTPVVAFCVEIVRPKRTVSA